ncbi:MAG: pyridoxamine 5'-phosphate oxidase family protein [Candidatus Omnitrophica bacterium]|nr:pyridoxamine 5'-phosphate oxidase family protein [Candidatus Omnitrophota bacterium]MDD5552268.1 pyridoxamine 5'-phosphate oxidase family protein [Candidatus Omnitrophota bacterium]
MKRLSEEIIRFFYSQGFVIVSTIDKEGLAHNSCKGLIEINHNGMVYLLDLYRARTLENLKNNPSIGVTAVDEHKFVGYSLVGKAKVLHEEQLKPHIIKAWESRISSRLTQRLLRNIREEKGHPRHPEILLPRPEYMIAMEVERVIDLTPHHLK